MKLKACIMLVFLCLAACQTDSEAPDLSHRILLWHSWNEAETAILDQVLQEIPEILPNTKVISVAIPAPELLERYKITASQGLGPDLLLGPADWIQELATPNLIQTLPVSQITESTYYPATIEAVEYQGGIYAYPLSLNTLALYYNTSLTDKPVANLDELSALAEAGQTLAFVPEFVPAHWGIQPFGNGLFDKDERFTLTGSGFTEWLVWLNENQSDSGIILNRDPTALKKLFIQNRLTYYVADSRELQTLQTEMGADKIGVAPLPDGSSGSLSGPLLQVEGLMFNPASTQEQRTLALLVAQYLTNAQQSTIFMRELNHIPANRQVRVDSRVYPKLSGFARQARSAVNLPNNLSRKEFYELGNRAYNNVLSGILDPSQAVCKFGLAVVALQNYTETQTDLPPACTEVTNE